MTRLNAALRDAIEDLRIRWILARGRSRAKRPAGRRSTSAAGAISAKRSPGERTITKNVPNNVRQDTLQCAIRAAADAMRDAAGEEINFVILMQPVTPGGGFQTLSSMGKNSTLAMLMHSIKGLTSGSAKDVEKPIAN
jgi:hypothetical protein